MGQFLRGRNPFVNQVSFFGNSYATLQHLSASQSLRKSGQFLYVTTRKLSRIEACRNPFVNQVSFFRESWLIHSLSVSGRNPFVNQVSFFTAGCTRTSTAGWVSGRNPFVNQVSFFAKLLSEYWCRRFTASQSLRKSGQFLFKRWLNGFRACRIRRNPFVNQVSFFVCTPLI